LVKFDIASDPRFRDGLTVLHVPHSVEIVQCLANIAQQGYNWQSFVTTFGWQPVGWTGENTYPGGNEMHYFYVRGQSGQLYEVFGYTYDEVIVTCALGRLA